MMGFLRKFLTVVGTIGIFVAFGVVIAVMGSLRPKPEQKEVEVAPPAVFYTVAKAEAVTLDVRAQGEVRPRTEITLTSQVAGRIVSTSPAFLDGGAFNEGDILIKVEDADYRAQLAAARAQLARANEALRLEEAEAALARRDYEELGQADEPSDLALRLPQLAQARADFESARASVRSAEINLARTEIRAPFKGRVRSRTAGEGQFVSPGAQLGRIFSTDVAEIRLPLTDNDLAKLGLPISFVEDSDMKGPAADFSAVVAGEMHHWTGRIARTDGAIDPTTRQISAIAVVDDPYGAGASPEGMPLAIGLYVDAVVVGRPFERAFVLPRSALYGRDRVYVIAADDLLDERVVNVVSASADTVTISAGVEEGERIAISPLRGAGEGAKVAPTEPDAGGQRSPSGALSADAGGMQ